VISGQLPVWTSEPSPCIASAGLASQNEGASGSNWKGAACVVFPLEPARRIGEKNIGGRRSCGNCCGGSRPPPRGAHLWRAGRSLTRHHGFGHGWRAGIEWGAGVRHEGNGCILPPGEAALTASWAVWRRELRPGNLHLITASTIAIARRVPVLRCGSYSVAGDR